MHPPDPKAARILIHRAETVKARQSSRRTKGTTGRVRCLTAQIARND